MNGGRCAVAFAPLEILDVSILALGGHRANVPTKVRLVGIRTFAAQEAIVARSIESGFSKVWLPSLEACTRLGIRRPKVT